MPYTVGYRAGVATDPERLAWRSSSPRPLAWAAWYPAARDVVPTEKLIGSPGAELFKMGLVAECSEINPRQDRWPIVLMSHGTLGWQSPQLIGRACPVNIPKPPSEDVGMVVDMVHAGVLIAYETERNCP